MKTILTFLATISLCLYVNSQTVFKTPAGNKYHLSSCRMVKNVSEEITTAKAIQLGLTPCKICNPANIYASNLPVSHKAQGQDKGVQCKGLSKKGIRCKHMTRIANGYCYQHQPEKIP